MLIYSITTNLRKDLEKEWLDWMVNFHIPNVMAAGYFSGRKIFKVLIPSGVTDEVTYVVQYECESLEKYLKYSETEAPRLQEEFKSKFVGKAVTARSIMELLDN